MKNFKQVVLFAMSIVAFSGIANADKNEKSMNEFVCRNAVLTQFKQHCTNYCKEKYRGKENADCVTKNCAGFSGYGNLAVMKGREDYPGTLKASITKNQIPEEFYRHVKEYELCLQDPTTSPKAPGEQWSEGVEHAVGYEDDESNKK